MKFSSYLTTSLIVASLIFVVLFWGAVYYYTEQNTELNAFNALDALADIEQNRLEAAIDHELLLLDSISSRTQLRRSLKSYLGEHHEPSLEHMDTIISDAIVNIPTVESIMIYTLHDEALFASTCGNHPAATGRIRENRHDRFVSVFFQNDTLCTISSGPLILEGELLGTLVVSFDPAPLFFPNVHEQLEDATDIVIAVEHPEGSATVISNRNFHDGNHTRDVISLAEGDVPIVRALSNEEIRMEGLDYRKEPVVAVTRSIDDLGIGIVAQIDKSALSSALLRINALILALLLIVTVAFSILVSYVLSSYISKPLNQLTRAVETFNPDTLSFPITQKKSYPEEIRGFISAFKGIIANIKEERKEKEAASKRLQAEVRQKIKNFDTQLQEEENMRLATMNILEDISEARERLKEEDLRKNELFNITSHELKTPLVPIKGYLGLVMEEKYGKVNDRQKGALRVVQRNALRLESLIADVLDIARLQAGKMKLNISRMRLDSVARDVVHGMQSMAQERGIYLKLKAEAKPIVLGDYNRIYQVISNFIKNAVKFTGKGGITVKVSNPASGPRLEVIDTGLGIAPENQSKIFQRFYQVDSSITRKFGGTGLGLFICKGIIENHGGKIFVRSALGEGSTFGFELPKKSPLTKGASYGMGVKIGAIESRKPSTPSSFVARAKQKKLPRGKRAAAPKKKSTAADMVGAFKR